MIEYHQVQTIAKAIFPTGEVEESFIDCELSIYTGLYNVAEGGAEEAVSNNSSYPSRIILNCYDRDWETWL